MKRIKTSHKILLYIIFGLNLTIFFFLILLIFPKDLTDLPKEEYTLEIKIEEQTPLRSKEEQILSEMTVEEKVGQLFLFGFEGTEINETNKKILENCNVGGVLLLKRNIIDEQQLKKLIIDLQKLNDIPLFTAIDQEGGTVARIGWSEILTRSQAEMNTSTEAYSVAKERGEILKSYGVNMNLAPVAEHITDTSSFLYNRTFSGTQTEVAQKSINAVNGYTEAGIIAVPKHFPGHSNTSADSHYSLPAVNIKESEWVGYIKPFTDILSGTNVNALMIGHVQYPYIDKHPSSISSEIITNRLINDLDYRGLIITDDMEMAALTDAGSEKEVARNALLAGNDILIYSRYNNNNPSLREDIYAYIVKEVKQGNIDIDQKVLKILKSKVAFGILPL